MRERDGIKTRISGQNAARNGDFNAAESTVNRLYSDYYSRFFLSHDSSFSKCLVALYIGAAGRCLVDLSIGDASDKSCGSANKFDVLPHSFSF